MQKIGDCPHCKIPMLVERRYYDDGDYHEFYVCDKCGADYCLVTSIFWF